MNNKVDELVPQHDLRVEVGDQEADVIALHIMAINDLVVVVYHVPIVAMDMGC